METLILDRAQLIFMCGPNDFHVEICKDLLIADTWIENLGILGRDVLNRFDITSDINNKRICLNRIQSIHPESFRTISV